MVEKKKIKKWLHDLLFYSFFGIYIFILFAFLFLKRTSFRSVNLVPFKSIMNHINGDMLARAFALNNIIGNIALFFPLGIYIALVSGKRVRVNMCLIAFISVDAEIAQYVFSVGVADVDDVILNSVGGLGGVLTLKLIQRILGEKTRAAIEILAPIAGITTILILLYHA